MFLKPFANLLLMPEDGGAGGNGGSSSGNDAPAWTKQLSSDLQGNEVLTGFKTITDLGKAFIERGGEVESLKGKVATALFIPGEKATDEERNAFLTKLGRPEKPEAYSFKLPEDFPKDIPWDEKEFRQWAFEEGLSDKQASNFLTRYTAKLKAQLEEFRETGKKALEEAQAALRKEWAGDYDKNVELANRAVAKLFGEEGAKKFKEMGFDTEPLVARLAHAFGSAIGEDALPPPANRGSESDDRVAIEKMFPSMKKQGGTGG